MAGYRSTHHRIDSTQVFAPLRFANPLDHRLLIDVEQETRVEPVDHLQRVDRVPAQPQHVNAFAVGARDELVQAVRQAVTVVSMPPTRRDLDVRAIRRHFAARTRAVLLAPYERLLDSGEPIRYDALSTASRDAWLKIAAAGAEGL